ncbi:MAG: isoprenylcysteine carboxylmethyltransferase family protein [Lachnospiraceae bacterium]|nr:isoprenylcysteine carboxylmethyltransferase family protein [Lachnospiraceae bacterium]
MENKKDKLFLEAIIKFSLGVIIVGLLIFIPAGSILYVQGWIFMGILFIPMFIAGLFMIVKNPELLKSRLDAKENEKDQSLVVKLSGLMFLIGFIVSGLNFRFQWYILPFKASIIAAIIFLLSYLLYAEVLRENTYLSRTIKVQKNQIVIDTGLYGIVRHPMYSVTVLLFLSMPIVLGSFYSFIIFLSYPFIIVKRIKGEEELLKRELQGYESYMKKVKYRLIPMIW